MTESRQTLPSTKLLTLYLDHGHRQRHFAHGTPLAHHHAPVRDLLNDDDGTLLLLAIAPRPIEIMTVTISARVLPRHRIEVAQAEGGDGTVASHQCRPRPEAEAAHEA